MNIRRRTQPDMNSASFERIVEGNDLVSLCRSMVMAESFNARHQTPHARRSLFPNFRHFLVQKSGEALIFLRDHRSDSDFRFL
jgi:hypothetical protein